MPELPTPVRSRREWPLDEAWTHTAVLSECNGECVTEILDGEDRTLMKSFMHHSSRVDAEERVAKLLAGDWKRFTERE